MLRLSQQMQFVHVSKKTQSKPKHRSSSSGEWSQRSSFGEAEIMQMTRWWLTQASNVLSKNINSDAIYVQFLKFCSCPKFCLNFFVVSNFRTHGRSSWGRVCLSSSWMKSAHWLQNIKVCVAIKKILKSKILIFKICWRLRRQQILHLKKN